jgi:hypothetical protein
LSKIDIFSILNETKAFKGEEINNLTIVFDKKINEVKAKKKIYEDCLAGSQNQ